MKSDLNGFTDYLQLTPAMFYGIIIGFFVVEVILMHINTQASKPPFGERWKGQESTNYSAGSSLTHHRLMRSELPTRKTSVLQS